MNHCRVGRRTRATLEPPDEPHGELRDDAERVKTDIAVAVVTFTVDRIVPASQLRARTSALSTVQLPRLGRDLR